MFLIQIQSAVRQATEQLQDLQHLQQQRNELQQQQQLRIKQKQHQLSEHQQLYEQHQQQQQLHGHQENQQLARAGDCQLLAVKCEPESWLTSSSSSSNSQSPLSLITTSRRSPHLHSSPSEPQRRTHFPSPPSHATAASCAAPTLPTQRSSAFVSPKMSGSPPSQPSPAMTRLELAADENIQLEELEEFAKEFKQRRIKLGYTQVTRGLQKGNQGFTNR